MPVDLSPSFAAFSLLDRVSYFLVRDTSLRPF